MHIFIELLSTIINIPTWSGAPTRIGLYLQQEQAGPDEIFCGISSGSSLFAKIAVYGYPDNKGLKVNLGIPWVKVQNPKS